MFGFVRHDCEVSADIAISKANGQWIDDRKLFVKMSFFYKNEDKNDERQINPNKNNLDLNEWVGVVSSRNTMVSTSFATTLKGGLGGKGTYANVVNGVLGGKGNNKRMEEGSIKEE